MAKIFKFTEEQLTMYNTLMSAALTNVFIERCVKSGLVTPTEFKEKIFTPDFVKNHLQDAVGDEMDDITNFSFDMKLFEFNEEE